MACTSWLCVLLIIIYAQISNSGFYNQNVTHTHTHIHTQTHPLMFKWRLYPWVSISGQLALISPPTVERETAPGWDFHPLVTPLSLSSHSLQTYKHKGADIILISTTWEADLHCG